MGKLLSVTYRPAAYIALGAFSMLCLFNFPLHARKQVEIADDTANVHGTVTFENFGLNQYKLTFQGTSRLPEQPKRESTEETPLGFSLSTDLGAMKRLGMDSMRFDNVAGRLWYDGDGK